MSDTPVHDAERARLQNKKWIQTYTGRRFWPLDPRPEDVCIEDIAHALALKTRYTGHTRIPYSVAEHCVRCSRIVSPAFALPALLHDAAEAYLPDLAAPIKRKFFVDTALMPDGDDVSFVYLESAVLDEIFKGLGLFALRLVAESEQVKKADLIMLATEARELMVFRPPDGDECPTLADWQLTEKPHEFGFHDKLGWGWEMAEREFLKRFKELNT